MSEGRTIQSSLNGGELSPTVMGQITAEHYFAGSRTHLNWVPLAQGGTRVRGAFKYAGTTKDSTRASYMFSFIFSQATVYALEFGHLYIRIWKYDANGEPVQVLSGGVPVEVTTTYTETEVPDLDIKESADVLFIVHPSHAPAQLSRLSDTSWTLYDVGFYPPATYEPHLLPVATLTASAASGSGVNFTSSAAATFLAADVGRHLVTTGGATALITSLTSDTIVVGTVIQSAFSLVAYASQTWWMDGSPNAGLDLLQTDYLSGYQATPGLGEVVGFIAMTATLAHLDAFRAADVGKFIQTMSGTFLITTFTTARKVMAQVVAVPLDFQQAIHFAASGTWTLEEPTWTATRGYPSHLALGDSRIWYAGAASEPDRIISTPVGSFFAFEPGTRADQTVDFTLATDEVNIIQWMLFWQGLQIGTLGSELTATGPNNGPITPSDAPNINPSTLVGSEAIRPTRVVNALLFVESGGRKVQETKFDFVSNNFLTDDLMLYAEHLTFTATFTRSAYTRSPYPIVWYLRSDGVLCSFSYNRAQKVYGWARQTTRTADSQSVILSGASLPNPVKKIDDLWCTITRVLNGATVRTVELLDWDRFLDCSKTYNGVATDTLTGLSHLEGEGVMVRGTAADGIVRVYPSQLVVGGQVTGLSPAVVTAEVGIAFTSTGQTVRLEMVGNETEQGRMKAFGPVTFRCYDTPCLIIAGIRYKAKGAVAGYDPSAVYVVPTTDAIAPALTDADVTVGQMGYDTDGTVTFVQDLPVGGRVLMWTADFVLGK